MRELAAIAVVLLALAAPAAAAAEPGEGERIGRHQVTRTSDGIEVAMPQDRRVGLALAGGGAVLAALGAGLVAAGRRGAGTAALLVGLGLAGLGAASALGATTVRASRTELVRAGAGGRSERWPAEAIAAVEVRRRAPSAEDFKRTGTRPWDVRLRAGDGGHLPVRFALTREADARALGAVLAETLGRPLEVR